MHHNLLTEKNVFLYFQCMVTKTTSSRSWSSVCVRNSTKEQVFQTPSVILGGRKSMCRARVLGRSSFQGCRRPLWPELGAEARLQPCLKDKQQPVHPGPFMYVDCFEHRHFLKCHPEKYTFHHCGEAPDFCSLN